MKKNKVTVLLIILILAISLIGCSNNVSKKAVKQGELALVKGEYDKALSSFELAINEGNSNEKIKEIYDILKKYKEVKNYLDEKDVKNAERALNEISDNYIKHPIKDDVDKLKKEVEDLKKSIKQDKKEAESKKREAKKTENKEIVEQEEDSIKVNRKREYLQRATAIQISVAEMYEGLISNSDMLDAANESYSRWDDLLNEIWGVLKDNLPADEMDKLTIRQRQWIKDKEAIAEKNSKEFEGGTMANLVYMDSLAQSTEKRCKLLIEEFMD